LLLRSYQLDLLDEFGNLMGQRETFRNSYHALLNQIQELNRLKEEEKSIHEKMELFSFQKDELEEARLLPNEDDELQKELNILTHAGEIKQLTSEGLHFLYEGDQAAYDELNAYVSRLSHYAEDHVHIANAVQQLKESLGYLDDAIHELRMLQDAVQVDDQRLADVEQRWNEINRLKSKYRVQKVEELISYLGEISEKLKDHQSNQDQIAKMEDTISANARQLKEIADELTDSRKKTAIGFAQLVEENIHLLAIPEGKLEIQFDKKQYIGDKTHGDLSHYNDKGQDGIDFYFSANRGSPIQLLKNAVSGGELSRLLLAIKKILSDKLEKRVIVFDEIDSGIGGKTADSLAGFIRSISKYHQVLCITHLPQIAAAGNHQYAIEKKAGIDRTEMYVELLSPENRVHEIARMLSGLTTDTALQHASELLNKNKGRD
ncbi:MAG TPA: DNA repair protein RecN, partial [Candidatus Cloacimonadota bacterium]|nr:DNA repair protein RecN [Candidatus Cloacimonadota bacterium]